MIRYLETEEKGRCLDLWREAFPEDSTEFCDYYFKEKMKDNKVLVEILFDLFKVVGHILDGAHRKRGIHLS